MDLGIIGLEQSGKSTLFQAVTRGHASTGGYAGLEPSIGVVKVPDERLDRLAAHFKPKKVTPAEVRFLDFPGSLSLRSEGPEPAHLAALAQCDALVHVVRCFRDETVAHPEGSVDPGRDVEAVNIELAFADLAVLARRHEKLEIAVRSARPGEREAGERELDLIRRLREGLERDEPLRAQELSSEDRRLLSGFQLLTNKPLIIVANIGEEDAPSSAELEGEYAARWAGPRVHVAAVCAKLERELQELPDDEAEEFRRELGAGAGGLDRLLRLSYQALGLITFFTCGEPDVHAWTVPQGATALQAAGKIHTDLERGFIRAEVIRWDELLACGSLAEARKQGKLRQEGKQYTVQDGDTLHILFNV